MQIKFLTGLLLILPLAALAATPNVPNNMDVHKNAAIATKQLNSILQSQSQPQQSTQSDTVETTHAVAKSTKVTNNQSKQLKKAVKTQTNSAVKTVAKTTTATKKANKSARKTVKNQIKAQQKTVVKQNKESFFERLKRDFSFSHKTVKTSGSAIAKHNLPALELGPVITKKQPSENTKPAPKPVFNLKKSLNSKAYNGVILTGDIQLQLHGGSHNEYITKINQQLVNGQVRNHILYLKSDQPSSVTLYMPSIEYIATYNNASIKGYNVRSQGLVIKSLNNSHILLNGQINLKAINSSDKSQVYIDWAKGNDIAVTLNNSSQIRLSGSTKQMHIQIQDHAILQAHFLRSQSTFVEASGNTIATVDAEKTLRGFATDSANIYYYGYPTNLTRFTKKNGNILAMANTVSTH